MGFAVVADAGPLGDMVADHAVILFIGPPLKGTVGMAEVDLGPGLAGSGHGLLQPLPVKELTAVVHRDGLEPLQELGQPHSALQSVKHSEHFLLGLGFELEDQRLTRAAVVHHQERRLALAFS